ncbi:MAG: N-acetylglucosaminidase, partial [Culicoidibacterales bacterium]
MKKLIVILAVVSMFVAQTTPLVAVATTIQNSQNTDTVTSNDNTETEDESSEELNPSDENETLNDEHISEDTNTDTETPTEELQENIVDENEVSLEIEVESEETSSSEQETVRDSKQKYTKIVAPITMGNTRAKRSVVEVENEYAKGQVNTYIDPTLIEQKQSDELEALQPLTDQEFEVAVMDENEEYYFVDSMDTYEEAVSSANMITETMSEEPVVINRRGIVVYSNSNVARIYKQVNGALYGGCDLNTDLYADASLNKTVGYTNHCYGDDAAVLQVQGDAAQIMLAGKIAWVRISTDVLFVAPNQVVNPSYYINENGNFVHYITTNLARVESGGSKLALGPTNSILQNNVKYYSFDGLYFYTDIEAIGPDMRDGIANNAVNANNPYYNYFLNLPFNSKAVATAAQIDSYINTNTQVTSKLRNTGQAFIDAQEKYGINAILMLGIAINESDWGMSKIAQEKNNLFGLNAIDSTPGESANYFPSVAQCINDYASDWLAQGYADPQDWRYYGGMLGNKSMGANVKYASDPYWSEKAAAHIYTVDRGINGGTSKEWQYYSLGLFTTTNSVKASNGQQVYPITGPDANGVLSLYSGYTNTPIVLKDTDASDGKYVVWPARNNTLSESNNVPTALPYNWNGSEYVSSSGVKIIAQGNINKPSGVGTSFRTMNVTNGKLELVSHASYANNIEAPIGMIKGNLISTDGASTIALEVAKLNEFEHKFSVDLSKLVVGKQYKFMITVDGNSEQVW